MSRQTKYVILTVLLLLSPAAMAASLFDVPLTDQSVKYLSFIFGSVGDVLGGSNTTLLKGVLLDFNNAVLVLGGIIIVYSLLVSTVNTAHEGEMLGKQWNSVWIPMRAAGGFALLLPVKTGGYALIQVFFMWVIVQGVGAADYIWDKGVDSIYAGQAVAISAPSDSMYQAALQVYLSQVCARDTAQYAGVDVSYKLVMDAQGNPASRDFGIADPNTPSDICGSIDYFPPAESTVVTLAPSTGGMLGAATPTSGTDSSTQADQTFVDQENQAIDQLWQQTDQAASTFMQSYASSSGSLSESQGNVIQNNLKVAAQNYSASISAANSQQQVTLSNPDESLAQQTAKTMGWIYAGAYYFSLTQELNQNVSSTVQGPEIESVYQSGGSSNIKGIWGDDITEFQVTVSAATKAGTPPGTKNLMSSGGVPSSDDINSYLKNNGLSTLQGWFLSMLTWWEGGFSQGQWIGSSIPTSPLVAISSFGFAMYSIAITLWAGYVGIMVVLATFLGGAGGSLLGMFGAEGGYTGLVMLGDLITAPIEILLGVMLVQGLTLAYYIPMIPFIVFTMGVIGWFILVVEGMVASPLLAIGILHPEGQHPVWGRGEVGIMLISSLFLRPSLMLVGFFASIVFAYVVVTVINIGFIPAALALSHFIVGWVFMMFLYTVLILIGINKCFTLIHVVPDRVMRWIGHTGDIASGAEQELGQMKGGAGDIGGKISGTGGQAAGDMSSTMTTAKQKRDTAARESEKKEDKGVSGS